MKIILLMTLFFNTFLQLTRYKRCLVLLSVLVLFTSCQEKIQQPKVINSTLDLSTWDFKSQGVLNFSGEWKFYWGKQISNHGQVENPTDYGTCNLVGFWTEEVSEGTICEQNGVATYHLELTLPDTLNVYYLKINTVYTAYELWGNGLLLAKVGEVGSTPETTKKDFHTRLIKLPQDQKIQLFLQIASWEHRRGGGVSDPILIGTEDQVREDWKHHFMGQLIAFIVIFTLSIQTLFFLQNVSLIAVDFE